MVLNGMMSSRSVDRAPTLRYRLEFTHPTAPTTVAFFGKYLEVVPDARIVWTNEESEDGPTERENPSFPPIDGRNKAYLCIIRGKAMNNAFKILSVFGKKTPDMGIDWEAQPSLQHLVVRGEDMHHDAPTWAETMPAPFDALEEPIMFREPLEGLSMRDIDEPEIFRVFFGEAEPTPARVRA